MSYYSDDLNVQLLLSLMKEHGIRKIVASPGVANITFVASVQHDSDFQVYSCVDERSAAYIACGMAEESGEPVAISCTGATASRNYMSALTEAYYRKLPILAVTSARDIAWVGMNSPQQIDRSVIPNDIAKYSLHLPNFNGEKDIKMYTPLINKALLELKRDGGGPVHINLTNGYTGKYTCENLPKARIIHRYGYEDIMPDLPKGKIGIFVGAHSKWSDRLISAVDRFCQCNNAVVLVDHLSNYRGKYAIQHNLITNQQKYRATCCDMDLMIHIGNTHGTDYTALRPKQIWRVNPDGEVRDTFGFLTSVYEMSEEYFFENYSHSNDIQNTYFYEWRKEREQLESKIPELPFSNLWIAQQTLPKLPKDVIIHFGIQNSLRTWNFFCGPNQMLGYCNTGGFGIDGCVSSLVGASLCNKDKLYFGVVGDLAFFYDMNVLGVREIGNNIRLLVVNNGRGQQFRNPFSAGGNFGEDADKFIAAAGHYGQQSPTLLKHYAEDLGFDYLRASSKEEYLHNLDIFLAPKPMDKSIVYEVFPMSDDEGESLRLICTLQTTIKREVKDSVKNILGGKASEALGSLIKKI